MTGGVEQRKPVTVLFADVVGSTALGEQRDPETVRTLMLRYFDAMSDVLDRHGGTVEKYIGDAIMAAFGLQQVHEDDALRAVRAAHEMRAELVQLNAELEAAWGVALESRIGVNSGEVLAGAPGGATLLTGDAVNVAARLQQAAEPGEILLGPATHRLVRDAVVAEEVAAIMAKGKAALIRPWRLIDVIAGAPGRARRLDTPFVGRTHELGLLDWAFQRVSRERTCHLVTVLGSAGVGKTRLATQFVAGLEGRAKVLTGRCLPYGEGITFWPVAEIVRQAAGIAEAETPADALEKLRAGLAELGSMNAAARVIGELAALLGLGEPTAGDPAWAVRKGLEALARDRPVVVVLEDLQWGEPTLLDLVEHVADWARDAPILLLVVARPELLDRRPAWAGGKVNATSLLLEPLSEDDAGELLAGLLGQAELEGDVRRRLVRAAAGNPLFLEELLAMLVDERLLEDDQGCWRPTADLSAFALPSTIHALLAARLDTVDAPERDILDRASVVGETFEQVAVTALTPGPSQPAVPVRLRTLLRKELLRVERSLEEDVYAFRHLLVRDAVYAALPKSTRAELHERFADWLATAAAERTGEYDELVGYHLEQAVRHRTDLRPSDPATPALARRGADHLAVGGRRALVRGDMPAAVTLLRRASDLLPGDAPERARLLTDLVPALTEVGDIVAATEALNEAAAVAEATGDVAVRTRSRLSRLILASSVDVIGWAAEATREAEQAISVLTDLDDHLGLAQAWSLLGEIRYQHGQVAASEEAFRRCAEHARRAGDARQEADIEAGLAWTALDGPLPVPEAMSRCEDILRRFDGNRSVAARVSCALAVLRAMDDDLGSAEALLARSIAGFTDLGQRYWLAATDHVAGRVALLAGDQARAERSFRAGAAQLERIGDAAYLPLVLASLSMVLEDAYSVEAAELVERCRSLAQPEDVMAQTPCRLADAHRHRRTGDRVAAVRAATDAVDLVARTDALDLQGDALATLGQMQQAAGDQQAAAAALRAALERYQRKGNVVSARRVRADLAAFGPSVSAPPGGESR